MCDIHVHPKGHLILSAQTPAEHAIVLAALQTAHHLDHDVLRTILWPFESLGEYFPIQPGVTGHVGLTDAPCITDQPVSDDLSVPGRLWAFMDYQVRSFAELLLRDGFVVFPLVGEAAS
jgi:hypothetical protein